jgi:hypothetical protein
VPEINVRQGSTKLISDSSTYSFGSVAADGDGGTASAWVEFTIENLGTAPLTLSGFSLYYTDTNPPFDRVGPTLGTVAAGASLTFTIRFDPFTTGTKTGYFIIDSNDSDEDEYWIDLIGTGI